jgi:hypothetical protein
VPVIKNKAVIPNDAGFTVTSTLNPTGWPAKACPDLIGNLWVYGEWKPAGTPFAKSGTRLAALVRPADKIAVFAIRPARPDIGGTGVVPRGTTGRDYAMGMPAGTVNRNSAPPPGAWVTVMSPSIASTRPFTMYRPRPVPPRRLPRQN